MEIVSRTDVEKDVQQKVIDFCSKGRGQQTALAHIIGVSYGCITHAKQGLRFNYKILEYFGYTTKTEIIYFRKDIAK